MAETRFSSSTQHAMDKEHGVRLLLRALRDKWRAPVLIGLRNGTLRYGELGRRLPGISRTMLTRTLRDLERGGLLKREVFAVVPSKVEYSLTEQGRTLTELVISLDDWAVRHDDELRALHDNLNPTSDAPKELET